MFALLYVLRKVYFTPIKQFDDMQDVPTGLMRSG